MSSRFVFLAALAAAPVFARAETPPQFEPVIVTATRSAQLVNRLPAALIVITREDIERSGATHLAEVLRGRGGIEVVDAFGDGSRTLVGLRGFGENAHANTLILVDGRRLNNPDLAAPDLNAIALQDVERIEIVQGSVGALLGDQAVGGVINIITREAEPGAFLQASGGSYAQAGVRGAAGGRWGDTGLRVAGQGRRTDNYREHNALEAENFSGRGDFPLGRGNAFVEVQAADERLETPGALFAAEMAADRRQSHPDFQGDYADTQTGAASAGLQQALGRHWAFELDASHRETDGRFRLSFRGFPATQDATQDRRITALAPRLTASLPVRSGALVLTAGVDAQRADYHLRSSIGPQSNDQTLLDGYAQAVVPLGLGLEAAAGARLARVENQLADNFVFPAGGEINDAEDALALGLTWRAAAGVRSFVRFDENFRFPRTDEYFGSTFTPGLVTLRTQKGRSYEAGAEWTGAQARASALLYRLALRDEIVFDPTAFVNANLDTTRRDGLLVEAGLTPVEAIELSASYTYVDAQVRSGTLAGKAVPLVARHVGRAALHYAPAAAWNVHAEILGAGARAFAGDFDNSLPKLPGYAVVNVAARYRPSRWHVEARLNNVGGREYVELGAETFTGEPSYFPSPGRNGWLGMGIEF